MQRIKRKNKNQSMKKRAVANFIYIIIMGAILLIGFLFVIVSPKDINDYENRPAEKIAALSVESYGNGEYQDSVEKALCDQLPFSENAKSIYNLLSSKMAVKALEFATAHGGKVIGSKPVPSNDWDCGIDVSAMSKRELRELDSFDMSLVEIYPKDSFSSDESYDKIGQYWLWKGHLLFALYPLNDSVKKNVDEFTATLNGWADRNKECNFYAFFIEKETEMNYLTGEKTGLADYLMNDFDFPDSNKAIYRIHSFKEYDDEYLKTDHHWNHKGAYRGYKLALSMLLPEEKPMVPLKEYYLGIASGSKSRTTATASFKEKYYAYDFDYPDMEIFVEGKKSDDYGREQEYLNVAKQGKTSYKPTYMKTFGMDKGEVKIDNLNNTGNGNILIIANSFDNAVIKPLATHYDCLYTVDLRYFKDYTGYEFDIDRYISEHDINTVMFFGDEMLYTNYGYTDLQRDLNGIF